MTMTTKEQERKALEQIKKIVAGLGENSYIATAFEGCFEKAEENIEYDAAFSWKGEAEFAEKKVKSLELDNRDLRAAVAAAKDSASKQITALQLRIEELEARNISADDLTDCIQLAQSEAYSARDMAEKAAEDIVKYADDPTSNMFVDAVHNHRMRVAQRDYYFDLVSRLDAVRCPT